MKFRTCFLAVLSLAHVYVANGSDHLKKGIFNTAIILKMRNPHTGKYDQVLLLRHIGSGKWMTPGGQVDDMAGAQAHGHTHPDASFEEAVVREFLEETGLKKFPAVKNVRFFRNQGTRIFMAETDDTINDTDFRYQTSEVTAHTWASVKNLSGRKAFVMHNGKKDGNIRNPGSFKKAFSNKKANWKHNSNLSTFKGASLSGGRNSGYVVMPGAKPSHPKTPGSTTSAGSLPASTGTAGTQPTGNNATSTGGSSQQGGDGKKEKGNGLVIGLVIGACVLAVVAAVVIFCMCKKKTPEADSNLVDGLEDLEADEQPI